VVAVIVARAGHAVTGADLVAFCRTEIAGYKRPRRVAFIDVLPRNASGKVLKRELRDRIAAGEITPQDL
jgi:fatty-acyl-CoA synthase